MKRSLVIVIALVLTLISVPCFAAEGGQKGASGKASERASQKSIFNRVNDWFSSKGKAGKQEKTSEKKRTRTEKKERTRTEKKERTRTEQTEKKQKGKKVE